MTASFETHDSRLVARIISLAHRFGCDCSRIDVKLRETGAPRAPASRIYDAHIAFTGASESLRRLDAQITKLLHEDKESIA